MKSGHERGIIITEYIALSGTAKLASAHENELRSYYPAELVDAAISFAEKADTEKCRIAAGKFPDTYIFDIGEKGLMAELWDMAESLESGLDIDVKSIPVKQESIEVCEFLDEDPYRIDSTGSLLIITESTLELKRSLEDEGIKASVIGRLTNSRARILWNNGRARYLDKNRGQE